MPIEVGSEKGQRILSFLKQELQIPEYVKHFSIHMGANEFITVECEYYPEEDEYNAGSMGDRPWLDEIVDWSQAPEWAEWAIQSSGGPIYLVEEFDHHSRSALGRGELHKAHAPLAHDWQAPLRRPKKTCPVCEGKGRWR